MRRKLSRSGGFTLMELLVVIAVIAILAGLVIQTAGAMQRKGQVSRAEAEIAGMTTALEAYKADMGTYPTGNNQAPATSNQFLRQALAPAVPNALNSLGKVYFEFAKGMAPRGTAAGAMDTAPVVDPWGQGYGYKFPGDPGRSGEEFFDLWSVGPDPANEASWIKNW